VGRLGEEQIPTIIHLVQIRWDLFIISTYNRLLLCPEWVIPLPAPITLVPHTTNLLHPTSDYTFAIRDTTSYQCHIDTQIEFCVIKGIVYIP